MQTPILPGSMLGVIGGGQLGRMFCIAARTMGYRLTVLDPDVHSPAGRIADRHIQAGYEDPQALAEIAAGCEAVTTEFENVPAGSIRLLAASCRVSPSAQALEVAQHRGREKSFARKAGLQPVQFAEITGSGDLADDFRRALAVTGTPAVLKTSSLGYDGKGQAVIATVDEAVAAFIEMGRVDCVLEQRVELASEVSVIVMRNYDGDTAVFPVAENAHRNGVLHSSIVPARVDPELARQARHQALQLAEALEYTGVLAVEFFIDVNGALLFNEMAPRPHNSGHYSKDACVTSQFEQQVRAMCNLPPGDTRLLSPVVMVNMLGDLWEPDWASILEHPGIKLHIYGKKEARPGRKMGHYNVLAEGVEEALEVATQVFSKLEK